ncbi:hypothetical protein [Fodinibius sediminis]|nr:hypothetical protein [Fodinibius sediminis]
MAKIRNDWTNAGISGSYHRPLKELIYQAATVHRQHPFLTDAA